MINDLSPGYSSWDLPILWEEEDLVGQNIFVPTNYQEITPTDTFVPEGMEPNMFDLTNSQEPIFNESFAILKENFVPENIEPTAERINITSALKKKTWSDKDHKELQRLFNLAVDSKKTFTTGEEFFAWIFNEESSFHKERNVNNLKAHAHHCTWNSGSTCSKVYEGLKRKIITRKIKQRREIDEEDSTLVKHTLWIENEHEDLQSCLFNAKENGKAYDTLDQLLGSFKNEAFFKNRGKKAVQTHINRCHREEGKTCTEVYNEIKDIFKRTLWMKDEHKELQNFLLKAKENKETYEKIDDFVNTLKNEKFFKVREIKTGAALKAIRNHIKACKQKSENEKSCSEVYNEVKKDIFVKKRKNQQEATKEKINTIGSSKIRKSQIFWEKEEHKSLQSRLFNAKENKQAYSTLYKFIESLKDEDFFKRREIEGVENAPLEAIRNHIKGCKGKNENGDTCTDIYNQVNKEIIKNHKKKRKKPEATGEETNLINPFIKKSKEKRKK